MIRQDYRARAAQARRLALWMTGDKDRAVLDALADEYGQRAREVEAAGRSGREMPRG